MRSRMFFYFVLMLLMALIGWFGYQTWRAYALFHPAQQSQHYLSKIGTYEKGIAQMEGERHASALFFGAHGTNYSAELKKARKASDQQIKRFKNDAELFATFEGKMEPLTHALTLVRANVDALNGTYPASVGESFDREIAPSLVKAQKAFARHFAIPILEKAAQIRADIGRIRSEVNAEKSLILYWIARKKPIAADELRYWETVMENRFDPDLSVLGDEELEESLQEALEEPESDEKLDALYTDILAHAHDGKFASTLDQVNQAFKAGDERIEEGYDLLEKRMEHEVTSRLTDAQNRLMWYGIGLLAGLILLVVMIRLFSSSRRERLALEETLKEMISDLPEEQQLELDEILKRGDRVSIYRFLADTTREARTAREEALIAREQALDAEKAKDLFLANMSHEIRTPLNGILGFTQLLESSGLNAEQKGFVDIIKGSSDNLLTIVNSILDLSKIRANKIDLEAIAFSPSEVFGDAIEPHEVQASDKKIRYCSYIDPHLTMLIGDPTRLRQVMTNLIGNAIKFTEAGGSIQVRIEQVASDEKYSTIRFSVRDSGIGITPEQKEKIFDAFSQADISTTRQFGGTGLGLTITSDLVKHMGGKLDVESEPGKGSEFFFTLTLEKAGDDGGIQHEFNHLRIAYYHPKNQHNRVCDGWAMQYLKEIAPNAVEIGTLPMDAVRRYDVLFIDYSVQQIREEIETILSLGVKVVPIGYISYKEEIDQYRADHVSIIFRPLNYTKITRALEILFKKRHADDETQRDRHDSEDISGLRVLVAEDNEINQNLIQAVLSKFDLHVTMANNGKEALELRKSHPFDLILMDIQMPVMGGIEATKMILAYEKAEEQRHVPIIALTANALQGDREKYLRAGMDDYVSKPIKIEQIRHVIQEHCATALKPKSDDARETIIDAQIVEPETTPPSTEPTPSGGSSDGAPHTAEEPPAAATESTPTAAPVSVMAHAEPHASQSSPLSDAASQAAAESSDEDAPNTVKDVLLYFESNIVQKVHMHALEKENLAIDLATDEASLVEHLETVRYRYVLLDGRLIPSDNCVLIDVIRERGAHPYVYSLEEDHACAGKVDGYAMIKELHTTLVS